MSALFEKRLTEWAVWFHQNRENQMSIDKRIAFMQKNIDGLMELLALAAKDIQRLEHRNGNAEVRQILLPKGLIFDEPLRSKHG